MKRISEILPWPILSKKAFWDRSVLLVAWREKVQEKHPSYLPGTISTFDPTEFIYYYGIDAFKTEWPKLRQGIEAVAAQRLPIFDLAWSRLVSGSWNVPPDERVASLPARKRDFLFAVGRTPGGSIYATANALGMQYKRAHVHARDLCDAGLLRMQPSIENGRMRNLLFTVPLKPPTTTQRLKPFPNETASLAFADPVTPPPIEAAQ